MTCHRHPDVHPGGHIATSERCCRRWKPLRRTGHGEGRSSASGSNRSHNDQHRQPLALGRRGAHQAGMGNEPSSTTPYPRQGKGDPVEDGPGVPSTTIQRRQPGAAPAHARPHAAATQVRRSTDESDKSGHGDGGSGHHAAGEAPPASGRRAPPPAQSDRGTRYWRVGGLPRRGTRGGRRWSTRDCRGARNPRS